jgi:LAO/AO transport system kinase
LSSSGRGTRGIDVAGYAEGVRAGDRATLARAITLVESTKAEHRPLATALIDLLLPESGRSERVGISGVPGAGKSTFIDELGTRLTGAGHRVAVLAVDPSSTRTGGSILGDKTRMARLSNDERAYIRPSPTSGTLGGVTRATRAAMVILEAAGYDVIVVETVGVGQSEVAVANMVDCFVVLTVARTGDSLQGIKRGILELAEIVVVNKADGGHEADAAATAHELEEAMHLSQPAYAEWMPAALTCSALTGAGVAEVWAAIERHRAVLAASGAREERRASQQVEWMWATVRDRLLRGVREAPGVRRELPELEAQVRDGSLSAGAAAERILALFGGSGEAGFGGSGEAGAPFV